MKPHGPWTILASHPIYCDPWVSVSRDDVIRPDGKPGSHIVVDIKAGVAVLALDDSGSVYLTDEFHYGVGRRTLEVVSGGCDSGEDPLLTAQRELREELGITAAEWAALGIVDPFTSIGVSPTRLYLAQKLTFGEHEQEGTENIHCVKMMLAEAVAAVMDGRITHGPSGVLIFKAFHLLTGGLSNAENTVR
jgi:ADP-ribose pyrophosphatase